VLRADDNARLPLGVVADKMDEDRAAAAFREHRDKVFRYLLRRTGDALEAEELTQQVFADAAAALQHERPNSVLAWLYTVAERRFVDELRRRSRVSPLAVDDDAIEVAAPTLEHAPEVRRALVEAVAVLPSDQQRVVVMKLFRGYSFSEIAMTLDASEAACKMRFSRAVRAIRLALSEQGLEP
jgi:RNA polymerase sigma-70 factor, ECF subfamily